MFFGQDEYDCIVTVSSARVHLKSKEMIFSDGSDYDVRSFEAKNRVVEFDYQRMNTFVSVACSKNDVRACLTNNLVYQAKAFKVQCLFVRSQNLGV